MLHWFIPVYWEHMKGILACMTCQQSGYCCLAMKVCTFIIEIQKWQWHEQDGCLFFYVTVPTQAVQEWMADTQSQRPRLFLTGCSTFLANALPTQSKMAYHLLSRWTKGWEGGTPLPCKGLTWKTYKSFPFAALWPEVSHKAISSCKRRR